MFFRGEYFGNFKICEIRVTFAPILNVARATICKNIGHNAVNAGPEPREA